MASKSTEDETVRALVQHAQDGDLDAFEAIVKTFEQPVFNLAYRMTGNRDDAFDLAQEVFIKLHRSIGRFQWKSKFSTWLFAVAANTCRSGLRRLARRQRFETVHLDEERPDGTRPDPPDPADPAAEQIGRQEARRQVEEAIADLPEGFRIVIALRDLEGLTYEEVAEAVGCSVGTVKSRLARARLRVKDHLVRQGILGHQLT